MMNEEPNGGRVTVTQLFSALSDFREEMTNQFKELRSEMRSSYASAAVCEERRNQLTEMQTAIDDLRKKVYIGVGVASALSFVVPLAVKAFS